MSAVHHANSMVQYSASVCIYVQRLHNVAGAPYRAMLADVNARACVEQGATSFPMAPAVVDDFGTLVLVGAWQ
jgi:hypothetical protein